jgi:hypothetical protein
MQPINRCSSEFKAFNGIAAVGGEKDVEFPAVPSELLLARAAIKRLEPV